MSCITLILTTLLLGSIADAQTDYRDDFLSSFLTIPGVQPGRMGLSDFVVRGGDPDQNLVLLDGIPVYSPVHLSGTLAACPGAGIYGTGFYDQFFPARFGGQASSVLYLNSADGDIHRLSGELGTDLLTGSFKLAFPLRKNRTALSINAGISNPYNYWSKTLADCGYLNDDLSVKLSHFVSERDRISLMYSRGDDRVIDKEEASSTRISRSGWTNSCAYLAWTHRDSSFFDADMSISYSAYDYLSSSADGNYVYNNGIHDLRLKTLFDLKLSGRNRFSWGGELARYSFTPERIQSPGSDYGGAQFGLELAAWGEFLCAIGEHVYFDGGLRLDYFNVSWVPYPTVQPRVSLAYKPDSQFIVKAGYSRMTQNLRRLDAFDKMFPIKVWLPVNKTIKPLIADHFNVNLEWSFARGWKLTVDAFLKAMQNTLSYRPGALITGYISDWTEKVYMSDDLSRGVEMSISRNIGKARGTVSYVLSKTDRQLYDRRHMLKLDAAYYFNDSFRIYANSFLASANSVLPALLELELGASARPRKGKDLFSLSVSLWDGIYFSNGSPLVVPSISYVLRF